MSDEPVGDLEAERWGHLREQIRAGECIVFVGAGANAPDSDNLPGLMSGSELATSLAAEFEYPLSNVTDLAAVTQYKLSLTGERWRAVRPLQQKLQESIDAVGDELPSILTTLADLRQPLYLTTNYDNLLVKALTTPDQTPRTLVLPWWRQTVGSRDFVVDADLAPMVVYLHGVLDREESILVTENDYLQFIERCVHRVDVERVFPAELMDRLANQPILFVGYGLRDINFRLIMRYLMKEVRQRDDMLTNVCVQLDKSSFPSDATPERRAEIRESVAKYLQSTMGGLRLGVFWGSARMFGERLRTLLAPESPGPS